MSLNLMSCLGFYSFVFFFSRFYFSLFVFFFPSGFFTLPIPHPVFILTAHNSSRSEWFFKAASLSKNDTTKSIVPILYM